MQYAKNGIVLGILAISFVLILSSCKKSDTKAETSIVNKELITTAESSAETLISSLKNIETNTDIESSFTFSEEEGENPNNYTEVKITISGNQYFYNNNEITLENLIELFDGLDKNDTVKIHDDYASDKAYENLVLVLKEREIPYMEE